MKKEPLLFLCHRIPFPPNKGDKIRSFNMLKALSQSFDIYLACFVDDPFDWQYADKLDNYCQQKLLIKQNKTVSKIKGLQAFISGEAISVPYYYSRRMAKWTNDIIAAHKIKQVFVYSSSMAQYVAGENYSELNRIIDFVDVDSDKWNQYSEGKTGLARWVYKREWRKLQSLENKIAEEFQHSLFVSPQEANLFKQQVSESVRLKVSGMLNGVDTAFFDPQNPDIQSAEENIDVVFTGAMDYWANIDAVIWFSEKVWPLVKASYPKASFFVVGGNPSSQIKALDGQLGIKVTGRVQDVRPYIKSAKVVVAPLQIARGLQNKVLEAMSMAKPVVATSMAIEGIEARNEEIKICDNAQDFSQQVIDYLNHSTCADNSRTWILENLQWQSSLSRLPSLFKDDELDVN
ncbi:TIGR03087 family PEP-CTERM/XrtA system glycosyltransferase [Paraglaciecola arctica]|nr:TIGR03087 family PEP-CTERM/XrtA system glycosyltransferase [Paraglaciecola arctica]